MVMKLSKTSNKKKT